MVLPEKKKGGGSQLCMPTQSNQNKEMGRVVLDVSQRQFCKKSRKDVIKTTIKGGQRRRVDREKGRD